MDIAVNLVEAYLRLNGYLTITEIGVQRRDPSMRYQAVTDVDIVAIRYPGKVHATDIDLEPDSSLLLIEDPGLFLADGLVDVILGEVKQGPAILNPPLREHEVLHQILERLDWIYEEGVDEVMSSLSAGRLAHNPGRSGATIRTRLVAFGASPGEPTLKTMPLAHVLEQVMLFMERFEDVVRPAQFGSPAAALLHLVSKCGYTLAPRHAEPGGGPSPR